MFWIGGVWPLGYTGCYQSKCPGWYISHAGCLHLTAQSITSSLKQLFNLSLKSGVIPSDWKTADYSNTQSDGSKANQLSSHFLTINCQQNSGTTCLFTCHRTPSVPSSTNCLSMGLLGGRSTVTAQLLHYTNQWLKALGGGKDVRFLWLQKSIQFCPSCTTYAVSGG